MDILYTILCAVFSIVVLFIITKLIGNKQLSQLNMFDYINGITIGSIAAEMATSLEHVAKPLTAMIIYGLFAVTASFASEKSIKVRKLLSGKSIILYENGKIYTENLHKAKIDINEFLMECRNNGYYNISDLQTAILEPNGQISIIPIAAKRPLTPSDINLFPEQDNPLYTLVLDGVIMDVNLKNCGRNREWLKKKLDEQKIGSIDEIVLATYDSSDNLSVYLKQRKNNTKDPYI